MWQWLERWSFVAAVAVFGVTLLMVWPPAAGASVIEIRTEGSGDIIRVSGGQNHNGAMVWNGTQWVVNSTWAHKYFMDTRTGTRLKEYETISYQGTSPVGDLPSHPGVTVTRSFYSYTWAARDGGLPYSIAAIEYRVHNTVTGKDVILRSRGSGTGIGGAHFDVYIDDETTAGAAIQTTALLGDPVWYTFPGRAADALARRRDETLRTGDLPGTDAAAGKFEADYFLDIQNGADLGPAGVGKSYEVRTGAVDPSTTKLVNLGSALITGFSLKWMDAAGNLKELRFSPFVLVEARQRDATLFPGVASIAGQNNTQWRSEVLVLNPGTQSGRQQRALIPRDASTPITSIDAPLAAGTLTRIPDLYAAMNAASGAGMLSFWPYDCTGLAWVRTFNQGSQGTFGQDVPPTRASAGNAAGAAMLFPISSAASAATGFRSNLLLLNLDGIIATFTLRSGAAVRTVDLQPTSYSQLSNLGAFLGLSPGVHVVSVSSNGRWAAYISTVDPASGDPTTMRGLAATPAGVVLFPGVAWLAGSLSTQWRSEAVLHNPGAAAASVLLEIVPKDGSTVVASTSLQLQPGEVWRIADLYAELHAPTGSGLLRVTGNVLTWVRTYNQGATATFGQDVPPVLPAGGAQAGTEVLFPVSRPLDSKKEFRSNLILYNHETYTLRYWIRSGALTRTYDVSPGAYAQINDMGSWLGLAPGWAAIGVGANGRWSGTVSTIDPYTGDPTTVIGLVP